jgi:hypothetical protein
MVSPWQPQVFLTPYLWMPGVYANIATPLPRAPTVNVNIGPAEALGDLFTIPFLGSAEVRFGPIGLLGDVFHSRSAPNSAPAMCFIRAAKSI